jgi:hypothetical protein
LERDDSSAVGRGRAGYGWLIYLNCMMTHGIANFELVKIFFAVIYCKKIVLALTLCQPSKKNYSYLPTMKLFCSEVADMQQMLYKEN